MKVLLSIIKPIIYSNLFVALSVAAYTHLTFILYDLPQQNAAIISLMVFCFTYTTYNGQRIFRLKQSSYKDLGERLKWVLKYQKILLVSSIILGIIGLSTLFFINPVCVILIIPMGAISLFYVVAIPIIKKGLREIAFMKIYAIAIVWSLIVIGIPFIEANGRNFFDKTFVLAFAQSVLFIVAITLPFDVRDLPFDKQTNLKTIPYVIGIENTIIVIQLLLSCSMTIFYFLPINKIHLIGIMIGHCITIAITLFTHKKRKELFYAGWVESTVIFLWGSVFILDYFFSP